MSDNPTTEPECRDPRKPEYWRAPFFGAASAEDSQCLAEIHQWKHIRAKIDDTLNNWGVDADDMLGLLGQIECLQGSLVRNEPVSFQSATAFLEIAANAILIKQTDPDSLAGDLTFALALIVRVQQALDQCEGWISWRGRGEHGARQTDPDVVKINTA